MPIRLSMQCTDCCCRCATFVIRTSPTLVKVGLETCSPLVHLQAYSASGAQLFFVLIPSAFSSFGFQRLGVAGLWRVIAALEIFKCKRWSAALTVGFLAWDCAELGLALVSQGSFIISYGSTNSRKEETNKDEAERRRRRSSRSSPTVW